MRFSYPRLVGGAVSVCAEGDMMQRSAAWALQASRMGHGTALSAPCRKMEIVILRGLDICGHWNGVMLGEKGCDLLHGGRLKAEKMAYRRAAAKVWTA